MAKEHRGDKMASPIPLEKKDPIENPRIVARQHAYLTGSQKILTAGLVADAAWKDEVEALRKVGEKITAEDTAPAKKAREGLVRRASGNSTG